MGQEVSRQATLSPGQRLNEAARAGNIEIVRALIAKFPLLDVNEPGVEGWTPLMEAALMGRTAVVYFLLEQPYIDPNRRSVDGLTALMMASWWGYAAVVHLLLRHPHTDVNAQNEEGLTALMKVAGSGSANNANPEQDKMRHRGHAKVMRMLLSHPNINVNLQDKNGNTALMLAARLSKPDLCETLLSHPATDPHIRNKRGKTALRMHKNRHVEQLLRDAMQQRPEGTCLAFQPSAPPPFSLSLTDDAKGLQEDEICCICLAKPRQCGFMHAGTMHAIVCKSCIRAIPVGSPCPMCRQLVEEIVEIPS